MKTSSIDWNEVWKEMIQANRKDDNKNRGDCANLWDSRENAERFWKRSCENRERVEKTLDELPLTPDCRVLDIGAGPGSLAIPLSERVSHVTAVEPSRGMLEILQENIERYGVENIDCVNKRWEDLDVGKDLKVPYDIVIASFSLGMPDIKEAIGKMQDASSKYVYLYWFAGETPWDDHSYKLWPLLYGENYTPSPRCDVLYNVLYSMGIYPDMHVFPLGYNNSFSSMDEAFDFFMSRYTIETDQQEKIIRDYLEETLEMQDNRIVENGHSTRVKLWWEKRRTFEI
ncbi:16S rRNA G527 N7-methylase RsmG [Methanohalophilus levihalophilus]|uniref:class I SAM-dependent methyltransferase n=1 Tax=Methanohalophilus levihalophilus TaxID=1431282 RepID=UPI001AE1C61C|nr:class I SAM-dependent methyltransferase [Methanohalophilus levihalophilus]MBP2030503.1 16S rRNA G527 N7-methylase RsmG [Methanohalophilus levihalophilus]